MLILKRGLFIFGPTFLQWNSIGAGLFSSMWEKHNLSSIVLKTVMNAMAATVGLVPLAASVRCKIQFRLLYLPIYLIFPSEYTHPLPASSFDEPLGGAQGKARQKNHQIFKTVGNYILITQNFPHDIRKWVIFLSPNISYTHCIVSASST